MELGTAALIATIGSAAIGTYAAVSTSVNQANAASTEAAMRTQEAQSARESATYEETQFRRRAAILMGKQEAIYGASGLDPSQGSPLFAELDSVRQAELEAQNIRRTGALSASAKEFEARMAQFRGTNASNQIGPTILGGIAKGAGEGLSSWSKYSKNIASGAV